VGKFSVLLICKSAGFNLQGVKAMTHKPMGSALLLMTVLLGCTGLWILSRTTSLDETVLKDLKAKAAKWGFDTKALITVKHDRFEHTD
jgi:hypothetical protein